MSTEVLLQPCEAAEPLMQGVPDTTQPGLPSPLDLRVQYSALE